MRTLTSLAHGLDARRLTCRVIIETPRGFRRYVEETAIRSTSWYWWMPCPVGCLIDVRLIGVIAAEQTERGRKQRNDRLLSVAIHSYQHERVTSISEISKALLSQIAEFFISYDRQRGKKFEVRALAGPKKALSLLQAGIRAHRQDQLN